MSRKRKAPVRKVYPDPKFHSEVVSKFINSIMYDGKRSTAEKILYDALDKIKQNYDYVSKKYRSASVSKKADILTSLQESVDEGMTKQQADITLKQLGGNKFIAMTGAKQFSFGKQGLGFRIGKNSKSINYVRVDLKSNDLYDMEFIRIRGTKIKVVKKVTGVYNDQLQKIFTKHTGLYTRL